ncbi:unnamed protein product [Phytomonas sp. Hart1]|nr:unnamed protein product [Phytomonas sp. Hart1]|eukprot:CCW67505.1 unnamed protein product [Phytomonas sp. isolate Hart1]
MEAQHAARVLSIPVKQLPSLTAADVERAWGRAYAAAAGVCREEVLTAAEVLLEYLDSALHREKCREDYREIIEKSRLAIDAELARTREGLWETFFYFFAVAMVGGCLLIFVMIALRYISPSSDASRITGEIGGLLNFTALSLHRDEDTSSSSRYLSSPPTAMSMDKRDGRYDQQFLHSEGIRLLSEHDEYRRGEADEIASMMRRGVNTDENEVSSSSPSLSGGESQKPISFFGFARLLEEDINAGSYLQRLIKSSSFLLTGDNTNNYRNTSSER